MIGEICPFIYDISGKPVGAPTSKKHRRLFHRTFPMGRYVSQPLTRQCASIPELRRCLLHFKYVSDHQQFGKKDHWLPPDEFEQSRQGDCEDFALWTWRQLLGMGYRARFVVGRSGQYGNGHAWVTVELDGRHYIVESLAAVVGEWLPRLSVVRYEPVGSVEWDGERLHYFVHKKPRGGIPVMIYFLMVAEWLLFWSWCGLRIAARTPLFLPRLLARRIKRGLSPSP